MIRVLVDTNVVVSALLFPRSTPAEVLAHVLAAERLVLTQWVLEELGAVVSRKRPDLLPALDDFISSTDYELAAPDPTTRGPAIADSGDQPILDAAIASDVDVIVTGDKHFLVLDLDRPQVMTPREFLDSRSR